MKKKKMLQSEHSTLQEDLSKKADLDRDHNENGIVEYGKATQLTKGRGGRHSEPGYTRP